MVTCNVEGMSQIGLVGQEVSRAALELYQLGHDLGW